VDETKHRQHDTELAEGPLGSYRFHRKFITN